MKCRCIFTLKYWLSSIHSQQEIELVAHDKKAISCVLRIFLVRETDSHIIDIFGIFLFASLDRRKRCMIAILNITKRATAPTRFRNRASRYLLAKSTRQKFRDGLQGGSNIFSKYRSDRNKCNIASGSSNTFRQIHTILASLQQKWIVRAKNFVERRT